MPTDAEGHAVYSNYPTRCAPCLGRRNAQGIHPRCWGLVRDVSKDLINLYWCECTCGLPVVLEKDGSAITEQGI